MVETRLERPGLTFVPLSTDAGKIRFFGTLMPAVLLLKASPGDSSTPKSPSTRH